MVSIDYHSKEKKMKEINETTGPLKDEDRAGLNYAKDPDDVLKSAYEAVSGIRYTCPSCGCLMHPASTKKGKRFFARNPGQYHTKPACITIESKGVEYTFNGLDPKKFIVGLCHASPRKKKGPAPGPNPPTPGPNPPTPGNNQPEDDFGGKQQPFTSLAQIASSLIENLNANDYQGEHKVSDFILTYKYGLDLLCSPGFILGVRIVYGRYLFSINRNRTLVFSMFRDGISVKFCVTFTKHKDYISFRDKFGRYAEDDKGKTRFKKHYDTQDVLIACDDWRPISRPACAEVCSSDKDYCKSCYGMYQAIFTNSKQIYLIPADH